MLSESEEERLKSYMSVFRDMSSETYLPAIADLVSRIRDASVKGNGDGETALACLRYVVERNDVVHDSFGYLGLVDDIYAIETTYRQIENRFTWMPLLDHFNSLWPYVMRIAFEDDEKTLRLTPYLRAIFGTELFSLTQDGSKNCIVLPDTEICGLIGAFLACIESIRNQATGEIHRRELAVGEDLLLGDAAITVKVRYAGVLEHGGQKFHSVHIRNGRRTVTENILTIARRPARPHGYLSWSIINERLQEDRGLLPEKFRTCPAR